MYIISLQGTLRFSLSLVFTRNGILIAPYNSSKCLSIKSVCLVRKDDNDDAMTYPPPPSPSQPSPPRIASNKEKENDVMWHMS